MLYLYPHRNKFKSNINWLIFQNAAPQNASRAPIHKYFGDYELEHEGKLENRHTVLEGNGTFFCKNLMRLCLSG